MSFTVSEYGGLTLVHATVDEAQIQAALARLDSRLFLDPEWEQHGPRGGYYFYTVKQWVGSGHPPVCVLEWRDREGPWPLAWGIVDRVKRQEGVIADAYARVMAANEQKRQQAVKRVGDEAYEVGLDARKATGKTSAVLPRSQGLRMSRDRARAKGKKV